MLSTVSKTDRILSAFYKLRCSSLTFIYKVKTLYFVVLLDVPTGDRAYLAFLYQYSSQQVGESGPGIFKCQDFDKRFAHINC